MRERVYRLAFSRYRSRATKNIEDPIGRIKTNFASVYLTLISVIQAGVLGYFIYMCDQEIGTINNVTVEQIIPLFVTFIVIVTTWNEYMMGSAALRWVPSLKDSIIPFILGISELFVIRYVFSFTASWFYSLAFFCIVGFIAFFNMFYFARRQPENAVIFLNLGRLPSDTLIWTFFAAAVFSCLGFLNSENSSDGRTYYESMLLCLLIFSAFLHRGVRYWRRITTSTDE